MITIEDSTLTDLSDLIGLLENQSESLALDFESLSGDPTDIIITPVKPITEPMPDLYLESDWQPIIEELFYTSELS